MAWIPSNQGIIFLRKQVIMGRKSWSAAFGTVVLLWVAQAAWGADPIFRTFDGSRTRADGLGAAGSPLMRLAPSDYPGDGSGATILGEPARPNPRDISNRLVAQDGASIVSPFGYSDYIWAWGQFLDHDIDLTDSHSSAGSADIAVHDPADPFYPGPIPVTRSHYVAGTGTAGTPRQQVNAITSFIDGSQVYGSDSARAAALRAPTQGRLLTGAGDLLPFNTNNLPNAGGTGSHLFLAGDIRANEQVGLTALHTLFVREHNRLSTQIAAMHPGMPGEAVYQTARKVVGAELQSITYNEFLPALLGPSAPAAGDFAYSDDVDPSIANAFSTAFFRGHTMVSPEIALVDNDGVEQGALGLKDAFFNPGFLAGDPGGLDLVLKGLASRTAQDFDHQVVDELRNFLFGDPGQGGLDLAAVNIQRGRDHGLPDYNTMREAYGMDRVTEFDQITSDTTVEEALRDLFGNVDNIDPWVGAIAEDNIDGASVGELVARALAEQFTRLRDGDPFFYVGDADLWDLTGLGIDDIDDWTLADVIRANTGISNIQGSVFYNTVVPLPAGVWLLGSGLVGLGAALSRGRRRAVRCRGPSCQRSR